MQGARTRMTLRELRGDLLDLRAFLRKPLPTDVIAPVPPPPVMTSGAALGRARSLLWMARHSLTRAVCFFARVFRWKAMATRVATSHHDRP